MKVRIEPFGLKELLPLARRHYEEIGAGFGSFDLDAGPYLFAERSGLLIYATFRTEDGKLAGYLTGFILPHRAVRLALTFVVDAVYVLPEFQGRRGGVRLVKLACAEAKRRGARSAFVSVKRRHPELGGILRILGFEEEEVAWMRRL